MDVAGRLVSNFNLADGEAPQKPPNGREQPSTTLDHWAQLALRIGVVCVVPLMEADS
jgi:hypothetical protein